MRYEMLTLLAGKDFAMFCHVVNLKWTETHPTSRTSKSTCRCSISKGRPDCILCHKGLYLCLLPEKAIDTLKKNAAFPPKVLGLEF